MRGRILESTRAIHPSLDGKKGKPISVLGDGFVRFIDYMGTEFSIVQAARVSYGIDTKKVHNDRGLIRYLMRHHHTTPFEMCEIKFHVRCPIDVARQWFRHRTWSFNEYSTRYSKAIDSCHVPEPNQFRLQKKTNRQGSSGTLHPQDGSYLRDKRVLANKHARQHYEEQLRLGVTREQAREVLPLATYTEFYGKVDLHNLLHFLRLRLDAHAQEEIRAFAVAIADTVKEWVPEVWEAFEDYHLKALTLTRPDLDIVRRLHEGNSLNIQQSIATDKAREFGWFETRNNREREECEAKLVRLGLEVPWTEDGTLVA